MAKVKVGGFLDNSLVNGKGLRSVLFVSGCKHNCVGCHNEELKCFTYGEEQEIETVYKRIKNNLPLIKGVTFSGGDPMEQPLELAKLAKRVKELGLNIWCYTGYTFEDIINGSDDSKKELLKNIDILVDGPFVEDLKKDGLKFKGSINQRIIDVKESFKNKKTIELEM